MNISDIKVGMRVRRTRSGDGWPTHAKGMEFEVAAIGPRQEYEPYVIAEGHSIGHLVEFLEPVTAAEQLARAEAEVARIKAEIEADRMPKAGETWGCRSLVNAFANLKILHVEDGYVFGVEGLHPFGLKQKYIMDNYTRVDKTQDS